MAVHDGGIGTPPSATRVRLVSMRSGVMCAAQMRSTAFAAAQSSTRHVMRRELSSRWEATPLMPCEPAPQLLIKPVVPIL